MNILSQDEPKPQNDMIYVCTAHFFLDLKSVKHF